MSRKNGRFLNCIWIGTGGASKWHKQAAPTPMSPASVVPLPPPQLKLAALWSGDSELWPPDTGRKILGIVHRWISSVCCWIPLHYSPTQGGPMGWREEKSRLQEGLQQCIDDLIHMGAEIIWDTSFTQTAGSSKWLGWVAKGRRNKTERYESRKLGDEAFVSMNVGAVCKIFLSHVNSYQRTFTTEDSPFV